MKLVYSEIFDSAWKSIKDDLALAAGLSLVFMVGVGLFSHIPVLGPIVTLPLTAGYMKCLLKIRAREEFGFSDFFWGFTNLNRFLHLALLNLLITFGTVFGFVLLVVPGIWWMTSSSLSLSSFLLKGVDSVESIKTSLALVKNRWWNIAGLLLCAMLLNIAGAICLVIGVLISLPVSAMAVLIATEKLLADTSTLNPAPVTSLDSSTSVSETTIVP